ncbi:MAG: MgtC/SapB family protein [Candidatus Accumulibacter sp. UW26]|jgi:putative Mg2+ transporter-C (MgtC) family protein
MTLDPVVDLLLRFSVATVAGALIGLDRELLNKPAGLRTHALVALGAAIASGIVTWSPDGEVPVQADAISRVIQGTLTGIGFLGAGVIMRTDGGHAVHGLTTAASIWVTACLGSACGAGAWMVSASAVAFVMLILVVGRPVESWLLEKIGHAADDGKP